VKVTLELPDISNVKTRVMLGKKSCGGGPSGTIVMVLFMWSIPDPVHRQVWISV
jgi:hypothetical protein